MLRIISQYKADGVLISHHSKEKEKIMDLLNMLSGVLTSSSSIDALSSKTGTDSSQTKSIVSSALPMLLNALTDNASSEDGAASLSGALKQHTSTAKIADQIANADSEDGSKIIQHILGGNQQSTVDSIAKKTGADTSQISSLLSNIAPALMSGVSAAASASSKQTEEKSSGFDLSGLLGMFGGSDSDSEEKSSGGLGGILGGLGSLFGGSSDNKSDDSDSNAGSSLLGLLGSFMK